MSAPAEWFHAEVRRGLSKLVVLHLANSPGHETIEYTAQVWAETLWTAAIGWDAELDTLRLQGGFARLARQADRWPAPRQLLELLPERPQRPRLTKPPMSEAQRRRNQARLREMMAELGVGSKRGDRHG